MCVSRLLGLVLMAVSAAAFLIGALLAGMGIWLMYSKDQLRSILNLVNAVKLPQLEQPKAEAEALLSKYDLISTLGIVVLIIGCCIAGIAICGFLGAMCNMSILLLVYIIVTGALFIALLVSIIYFGTLKARMSDEIQKKLTDLQANYFVSVASMLNDMDSVKAPITVALSFMMLTLKCCGTAAIGDARNSASWLKSERRLTELTKGGAPIKPKASGDGPAWLVQAQAPAAAGQIPAWLKPSLPASITIMPPGVNTLPELPDGFELPKDFKEKLAVLDSTKSDYAETFKNLLDDMLTIRTPIACCEMTAVETLLKGKYDLKQIYGSMKNPSCAFSAVNVGVNQNTCVNAFMDYISRYQYTVVTTGMVLCCIVGGGLFCALWIFIFN